MVSTRGHPQAFGELENSPSKASHTSTTSRAARKGKWAHTPSNFTLIWLAVSLPLVIWDTGYVLLRPHTMPGGILHWPIYVPYELYGRIDHIYGWKAYNARNGFTAAQGTMNVVETVLFLYYLYIVYVYGRQTAAPGRGAPKPAQVGKLGQQRLVEGQRGAAAALVGFAAATMTTSKTVLYFLNEYYSGFDNIGHNTMFDLIFLWIIPNSPWIFVPGYMMYVFGGEILQGLTIVAGGAVPGSDDTTLVKVE